jgi:uncharacterized protein (DUF488 family)
MKVYTIGCSGTSAQDFFTRLRQAGVKRVLDVRLNNVSQLAGFAKRDDLAYFLANLGGVEYEHRLELAPTQELLEAFRKGRTDWPDYERRFRELMEQRDIERTVPRNLLDGACLLCSEHSAQHCHRRLVAEHFQDRWGGLEIVHL